MKAGITLSELANELERRENNKKDFVVDTREVKLDQIGEESPKWALEVPTQGFFEVTEHAHRQIADRIKIPAKYYDRMLTEAPNLLIDNVSHWFNEQPERRMIRTLDHTARAFLSDRYRRIDNEQVARVALPAILSRPDAVVLSSNVTDERLYLKIVFKDMEGEIRPGDTVRPGLIITNSEIGKGSLSIQSFFYRDFCTNGCVFGKEDAFSMRRNHTGKRVIEGVDFEVFTDETQRLQDETLLSEVSDMVAAAASPELFDKMIAKLQRLTQGEQVKNPIEAVEVLSKELNLRETEKDKVLENLIADRDYSQWGALNAVTKVANEHENYDRASEIEAMGAKIIELNNSQWLRIATAEKVAA